MNRRTAFQAMAGTAVVGTLTPRDSHGAAGRTRSPGRVLADDGTELCWSSWGDGSTTVLLVHSWAMHSGIWRHQIRGLTQAGFRVVTYDRRGHGRSQMTGHGYDMKTLTADLGAVVEQLGLSHFILVGHSLGAGEAVEYAAQDRLGRVQKLVLLAPITPCLTQGHDNPLGIDAAALKASREAMSSDFPRWASEQAEAYFRPSTSPETVAWGVRMLMDTPTPVALACAETLMSHDFRPALLRLKVPVLIIHGDADKSAPLPLTGEPTAQLVSGARLIVIPGAPHGLYETDSARVNQEIIRFSELADYHA